MPSKIEPLEAAQRFISTQFPRCQAALLAGSVGRGQATATSDLDIILFDDTLVSSRLIGNRSSKTDGTSSCSPIT